MRVVIVGWLAALPGCAVPATVFCPDELDCGAAQDTQDSPSDSNVDLDSGLDIDGPDPPRCDAFDDREWEPGSVVVDARFGFRGAGDQIVGWWPGEAPDTRSPPRVTVLLLGKTYDWDPSPRHTCVSYLEPPSGQAGATRWAVAGELVTGWRLDPGTFEVFDAPESLLAWGYEPCRCKDRSHRTPVPVTEVLAAATFAFAPSEEEPDRIDEALYSEFHEFDARREAGELLGGAALIGDGRPSDLKGTLWAYGQPVDASFTVWPDQYIARDELHDGTGELRNGVYRVTSPYTLPWSAVR